MAIMSQFYCVTSQPVDQTSLKLLHGPWFWVILTRRSVVDVYIFACLFLTVNWRMRRRNLNKGVYTQTDVPSGDSNKQYNYYRKRFSLQLVGRGKAVWYSLHKPGNRHSHLVIRHCTIRQQVFDCKYLSCKICFNVLNYVFILFILNLYRVVNIQQHCHNSSHCDWRHHTIYSKAVVKLYNNNVMPW